MKEFIFVRNWEWYLNETSGKTECRITVHGLEIYAAFQKIINKIISSQEDTTGTTQ